MAYNSGLDFTPRRTGAHRGMTGGVDAAANATVGENAAALNANKTDWAGLGKGAVEAYNYKERAIQDANASAERNKYAREAELDILAKDINARTLSLIHI